MKGKEKVGMLLFFIFVVMQMGSGAEIVLPKWAEPREFYWQFGVLKENKAREKQKEFLQSLLSIPREQQYVYGVANTLQVLVAEYVWREGRLPTLDEFRNSPYYVLHSQAFINPFSGERIEWVKEPKKGHLYYYYPLVDEDKGNKELHPVLVVPLIEQFSRRGEIPLQWEEPALGIWGVWPGPDVDWPTPRLAKTIDRSCAIREFLTSCYVRRYHAKQKNYTENDWRSFIAVQALRIIFSKIYHKFETGMPESLAEVREKYWWFYNSLLENPFTGEYIQEVPIQSNSPGDFTYAISIGGEMILTDFVARGKGGKKLYPYDLGDEFINFSNLVRADYIRGWEGRDYCDVRKEVLGEKSKPCKVGKRYFLPAPLRRELGAGNSPWWIESDPEMITVEEFMSRIP